MVSRTERRPLWQDLFRGYDIRGRYPLEIDPRTARRLGVAVARAFPGPFLIGRDTRRESERFARELERGLRSEGTFVERIGIVPTPEVAFLARSRRSFGLAVTPSHNAVGYVGLKGFSPSGRLFDKEWRFVRRAYESSGAEGAAPQGRERTAHSGSSPPADRTGSPPDGYLTHVTRGLGSHLNVVVDARGGATAQKGPAALRRLGNRVVELTHGFSPRFFGRSPEPRPETLAALSDRIVALDADVGFAFDGDGDRCVVLDEKGKVVEPEVVALLLHRTLASPRTPLVASVDASRRLERELPTVRSAVGGRYVNRAMRRAGAEVGMEPSGHYYLRRYGEDSDGILTACCVCDALAREGVRLGQLSRRFGPLYRGTLTQDFNSPPEARRAFRTILRSRARGLRVADDGAILTFPEGPCLVRRSRTQPSVRFAFEAANATGLRRLARSVREVAERSGHLTGPPVRRETGRPGDPRSGVGR